MTVLGIFTKAPIPGKVKTRTHSLFSPEEAAQLHRALVLDTLSLTRGVAAKRILFVAEGVEHPFIQEVAAKEGISVLPQEGPDLGARMQRALLEGGAAEGTPCCLIGTDSPHVPASMLKEAFLRLASKQVVIGPATDLGYYLIGCRGEVRDSLFADVAWGTSEVLPKTLRRIEQEGLSSSLLPFWYDIDNAEDIGLLRAHLPALIREDPLVCQETRAFFQRISL